jgi:hypothetical protein
MFAKDFGLYVINALRRTFAGFLPSFDPEAALPCHARVNMNWEAVLLTSGRFWQPPCQESIL